MNEEGGIEILDSVSASEIEGDQPVLTVTRLEIFPVVVHSPLTPCESTAKERYMPLNWNHLSSILALDTMI